VSLPPRRIVALALLIPGAACWSGAAPSSPAPSARDGVEVAQNGADANRLEEILSGQVPGLTVHRRADGTYTVRMRGSRCPADAEPLVLLDGVPLGGGTAHALADINPRDVERVEVIKDAASLSLYGIRGANGVIAITTRTR
jgi:TonB-dependent SusC/RagA subfamily outer membrane receptor